MLPGLSAPKPPAVTTAGFGACTQVRAPLKRPHAHMRAATKALRVRLLCLSNDVGRTHLGISHRHDHLGAVLCDAAGLILPAHHEALPQQKTLFLELRS